MKVITPPLSKEVINTLKAGESVLITGVIYTARDAAHKRMCDDYEKGIPFPFDLKGQLIYYAGPCPAKPGEVIGSCGPTTAGRMDAYAPSLLDNGLSAMLGKGARNPEVIDAMKRNTAVYLGAIGGAGALITGSVKKSEIIAYPELGTEAVRKLEVENLPCVVLVDCNGNDLYEEGQRKFRRI
ncbi:MAG: Fe-S-containing hydro-lyase [Clostridia bacterium]|nr:Fe-S-containing hydro-lyase [Clostridia bacterium]